MGLIHCVIVPLCIFRGSEFFPSIFRGYEIFSDEYFMGLIFFFMTNFVIQRFSISVQPVFTCSKLTIETLEQRVKYVQS